MATKREVSLFDSDYWQSLQNGKAPMAVPSPKKNPETVVKKDPVDGELKKNVSR